MCYVYLWRNIIVCIGGRIAGQDLADFHDRLVFVVDLCLHDVGNFGDERDGLKGKQEIESNPAAQPPGGGPGGGEQ